MRNCKQLGQGLNPAQKLGLVSCLCLAALGLPVGVGFPLRAQASPRRESSSTKAADLWSKQASLSPASDLSSAGRTPVKHQENLGAAPTPSKLGSLNLDHLLHRARQAAPTSEEEPTLKVGEQHQTARQPISTLYGYQMDGRQVVTVYVRDLPIISFVEQPELDTPLERATALVAQLNQMAQGSLKGTTITLDWTEPDSQAEKASPIYAIHVNDTELLRIDNGVMLVDGQRQVDTALLATNRLRRLLLDAPPIQAPALPQSATLVATAHQPEQPKTSLQQAATPATPYKVGMVQEGIASWYDLHKTRHEMTAAHPTLPFGTQVRVTNVENGRQAIVRINDRGPFIPGRIIDVSLRAAEVLGMVRSGVVPVRVEVLQP